MYPNTQGKFGKINHSFWSRFVCFAHWQVITVKIADVRVLTGVYNQDNRSFDITKTRLFKYTENFTIKKWKFSEKNSDIFHISVQNIDCAYSLEPPRRGGSNEYLNLCFWADKRKIICTPVNPSFTI